MRSQLLEHWYELIEAVGKNWRTQSHLHRILHQTQQPIQNLEIHLFQRDNAQCLIPNFFIEAVQLAE